MLPLHSVVVSLLGAPKFVSPASFHLAVAGASAGKFSSVCACFGVGLPPRPSAYLSRAATARVEPLPPTLQRVHPAATPSIATLGVLAAVSEVGAAAASRPDSIVDPTRGDGRCEALVPSRRPSLLDGAGVTIGLL